MFLRKIDEKGVTDAEAKVITTSLKSTKPCSPLTRACQEVENYVKVYMLP